MSTQQITDLWERIQSDEQFRGQLERATSAEEKRQIVTAAGFEVGPSDLATVHSLAGRSELSDKR